MKKNHIILSVALALSAAIPVCRAASICAPCDPLGITSCLSMASAESNAPAPLMVRDCTAAAFASDICAPSPLATTFSFESTANLPDDPENESSISRARLNSLISVCRTYKDVEIVKVGSVGMSLLKLAARISAEDEEDREALRAMNGIKSIAVMDYSECREGDRESISARIDHLIAGKTPIMELKDDGEAMFIYGVVSEDGSRIEDFVLYTPSDCALIGIFGSIDTATLAESAN